MQLAMAIRMVDDEVNGDTLERAIEFIAHDKRVLEELLAPVDLSEGVALMVFRPQNDPNRPLVGITCKHEDFPSVVGLISVMGGFDAPVMELGTAIVSFVGIDYAYIGVVLRKDDDGVEVIEARTNLSIEVDHLVGLRFDADDLFEVLGGITISA